MHLLWIAVTVYFHFFSASCVRIEKNGYKDIAIAFSEKLQQNTIDFDKLKFVLSNASELLYHATKRRSYLEEFILVAPSVWTNNGACEEYVTEAPQKVDIYFADSSEVPDLRTQHSKGCGQEGDIIYAPSNWLQGEVDDLAAQFVQQWSIFRYGVFPEKPERPGSCFSNSDDTWSPAGCYNTELNVVPQFNENGLPICYFPEGFTEREDLLSSIMFTTNSSKVLNYCDGSSSFPHNPIAPSLHNRICEGQTVWSVIKATEDFIYGRNLSLKDLRPPNNTAFRCIRESKTHVTLTIQNSSVAILSEAITEIRYALFHFLTNMVTADTRVNLLTFSEKASSQSVTLKLEDKKELRSTLDTHLKQNNTVSSVCFACGLEKAYQEVSDNRHSSEVIVLLSWENSFDNKKTSSIIELIQSHPKIILYLLFVDDDDTMNDIVPPELVDAVQDVGGRIFRLKKDPVFMVTQLNIALLDAFRNSLHTEDQTVVVHEKAYINVTSDFTDTFLTPRTVYGKLLYTMHCRTRGIIRNVNNTCEDWDTDSLTYKCGKEMTTTFYKPPVTVWRHHFERFDNIRPIMCSSLAMLRFEKPSTSPFTVRGWLNSNKITPGRNALIIYAEVFGAECQEVQAEARISGPGLESFRLDLRDNGNGDPDTVNGDGIFSRYFTSFSQKGTYVVSVHVMCRVEERDITYTDDIPEYDDRKLTQMKIIGSFSVTQSSSQEDILPPNRITDLTVVSINHQNRTVLLQWTAPGDDYDYGKAHEYKIYFSDDWRELQDPLLNKMSLNTFNTSMITPKISGEEERMMFHVPSSSLPSSYCIALKAIDKYKNEGALSNVIQAFIKFEESTPENFTSKNDTSNNTETIITSEFEENDSKDSIKWYIIAGALAIIFLIIIMNILIWILCFKRYKKTHQRNEMSDRELDMKLSRTGKNMYSDEDILRSEYESNYTNEQETEFPSNQDGNPEDLGRDNPTLMYAKVIKGNQRQELTSAKTYHGGNLKMQQGHNENDLGFV